MPGTMGGISHIFDSSKTRKSHKLAHKKRGDGFEAPRNSLDVSIGKSNGYHYITEDIPYSFQVKQHSSQMNYSNRTSMKKLIDGEISRRTSDSPVSLSVVARLMGMDSIPSERSLKNHAKEHEVDRSRKPLEINKAMEYSSGLETSWSSTSSRQTKQSSHLNGHSQDPRTERIRKLQPRKHPQEEQLQRFKKEFEAWQASKLREHPGSQKNHILGDGMDYQTLAQEILNKEKMAKYMDAKKNLVEKKPTEPREVVAPAKQNTDTPEGSSLQSHGHLNKQCHFISKNSNMIMNLGTTANDPEYLPIIWTSRKQERSFSSTQIVILKPNFDRIDSNEESLAASSDKLVEECSMEDFLEEVRDRLKNEIHGKSGSDVKARGSGMGNSFSERSIDPKQIARDIVKQIRESVTKDIGTSLMRSESTRSITSEIQINTPDSPEFIRRDTRKFPSEESKNVLQNEIILEKSLVNPGDSGASSMIKETAIPKPMPDFTNKENNVDYWKDKKAVTESTQRDKENIVALDPDSESQINLIRSFSAPVSGTAFGKFLLQDQHITGAQIRRKHETSEHNFSETRSRRKDSFNLRGRVSNLKHNFNLKVKLFGKKTFLINEPTANVFNSVKEIPTAPSIVANSGISQENSTEVPPSPASVSSSSPDGFCRQDNPSPISPLEVIEYHTSPCISEELNSNAPEQIELAGSKMTFEEQPQKQETIEMESGDAAYLRDILVTAGFYEDRSVDQANLRLDALHQVFEEVEKACSKYGKVDTESSILHNDDLTIGHKLLFDLVNEALQSVMGPKINCVMFKRWVLGAAASPQGKNLLDDLWNRIQLYLNPPVDESDSLNGTVVQDLKMITWPTMLYEDIDVVGRQIEGVILRDLMHDIVRDMCFSKT